MPNDRIDATELFLLQRLKSALLWCIYAFHYYIIIKLQQLVASRTIRGYSITPRDLECLLWDETADPMALPLSLLEEITDGFSNEQEIGRGAFAVVYKGKLENRTVAVKKMSIPYKYEKEFHREIECLMMAKHKNVVRFLGYCADTQGTMAMHEGKFVMADVQQKLLCFEYLPKGSLHEYITDTSRKPQWSHCYKIIMGICQGLHYLHQKNILHLDLKPANILLDNNWVPKITDFGISRCFDEMQSQVITNIAGTPGYMAPESFSHTEVTYRNSYRLDIYSLGVVIIEILTGEKGYHAVDKVVEIWSRSLEESHREVKQEQIRVCAEIGIECTNFNPTKRPDTRHIIARLDEIESMDGYTKADVITSQKHALWFRYQQLNPDVRRCIEYCSIFPRGSKLKMVDLICMWIAQGFVNTSCATENMEDVAEGYIQELVSCSFLQPIRTSFSTGCFTIHDVLHDILDKEVRNCFRIENESSHQGEGWEGDIPCDIQHLFIQNYDGELITEKILGLENLRTLIVYVVGKDTPIEEKVIESICMGLPKLRVLAFSFSQEHDPIKQPNKLSVPESVSQLKYLRYLAFRTNICCKISLPSTLNKLQHIQLLDFGDGDILEFTFAEIVSLGHLFFGSYVKLLYLGRLSSLQTLSSFIVSNEQGCELEQLRDLNKLRGKLFIGGLENVKSKEQALQANLAAKRLTELALRWDYDDDTECSPEVEAGVLEGMCPPVGLQILELWNFVGWRYLDWMVGMHSGGPKYLQQLCIMQCSQQGPTPQLAKAFPHLRVLKFHFCSWDALPGDMEHLTSLNKLVIFLCKNIMSLPSLPQSLEDFILSHCNDELMQSCQTVGHPNWQKIKHIPEKHFL